jgi:DNA-binding NarL/FixJ family response regulator
VHKTKLAEKPTCEINFTPREQQVLEHLCNGLSANEIASKMCLSKKTIEGYRTKLFNKTNTKNSISLIVFAIKNKIVSLT